MFIKTDTWKAFVAVRKPQKKEAQYCLVLHQSSLTSSFKLLTRTTGVPSPIPPLAPVAARKSGKK